MKKTERKNQLTEKKEKEQLLNMINDLYKDAMEIYSDISEEKNYSLRKQAIDKIPLNNAMKKVNDILKNKGN